MTRVALTIAGSDPSGGAGLQADLKTFHQWGVYGTSVVTLLTVQSTMGVHRVETVSPELVAQQLDVVIEDVPPRAAKTGALGSRALVELVAERARGFAFPLVVDPVMVSKHGHPLLSVDAQEAVRMKLMPVAALFTPNVPEAEALTGRRISTVAEALDAAKALGDFGAKAVLLKGGHLPGEPVDVLWSGGQATRFEGRRVMTKHTHGTGCTLSAAIVAQLAKGVTVELAVERAKRWLAAAMETAPGLGHGVGPVNHHAPVTE